DKARTAILIHSGTNVLESPLDRTEGCLLIGRGFIDMEFNEELITHSDYKIDLSKERKKLIKAIQEKEMRISQLKSKKLKQNDEIEELKKIELEFETYGKHHKDKIEPYINSSIKKLMAFIKRHKYANFTVHIKNDFKDK
ncbi:hypothetical protein, partial [Campylobacter troglodytis]|uniref:hypothetical protein n=1 Tax=Campylobacter troglodytis TaxID=654363 RepID=UPI00163CD610